MNQVYQIHQNNQTELTASQEENKFEKQEEIVNAIVKKGLPQNYDFSTKVSEIARDYGISYTEAKSSLRLAQKQIKPQETTKEDESQKEALNGQIGYYYPGVTKELKNSKNDGMDSLSAFASYNRMMFGF